MNNNVNPTPEFNQNSTVEQKQSNASTSAGSYQPPYTSRADGTSYASSQPNQPYGTAQNAYQGGQPYTSGARPAYYQSSPYGYAPYQNGAAYHVNNPYYAPKTKSEKRGASKGFVVTMFCLSLVFSLLLGACGGVFFHVLFGQESGLPTLSGGNVIVQYAPKEEDPVVLDKGTPAYAASIAKKTVVEVTTETITTDSVYGQYITTGAGSGVIISSGEDGSYILTCAHVISDANKVTVTLEDGTSYEAISMVYDNQTDVGIIKLNVSGLPVATLANFEEVVIGEGVIAIGNPLGKLNGSVSYGIISAFERDILIDGYTYHLLQTDAAVNPGHSGGGLFNLDGHLVGIVSAGPADTSVDGIGYAIPITTAVEIATQLIENGHVPGRPQLGFTLVEIQTQADVAKFWQYSRYFTDYGIYILSSLSEDFHVGDRLIAIDTVTMDSTADVLAALQKYEVGDVVTVTISRLNTAGRAEIQNISLTLTEKTQG